uniref:Alliin lyase n=1 Tax=Rhizophora mucronata TaxID=61149 RepID=A0A2P2IIT1_RHIMU
MYEVYWRQVGDKSTIVIPGWQSVSYFSDIRNLCWFLEPELSRQIVRLHKIVGNAVTKDRYIVVGTGSTQLYQAVLYALSPQDAEEPIAVVSAAPYYSSYPAITDCLKSRLYKWAGDAHGFNKEGPYIELVTSPNNPDGYSRQAVVNGSRGILVHDLAYYWPQYTPITSPADHEIMLFTVSKSTGHAGMRIGWALVKDQEIAKKMTKFIELSTIGVSKDSQLRAAKVLEVASNSCEHPASIKVSLFEFGYRQMAERWRLLRAAVKQSGLFSLPEFSPGLCKFSGRSFEPLPAFAWLKCEKPIEDCEAFLRQNKILTRSGKHFGVGPEYVRISFLDRDENTNLFIEKLSQISLREPM